MATDYMNIRLPIELKEKLQKLADKDKRSLSNYVKIILENHAEKKR